MNRSSPSVRARRRGDQGRWAALLPLVYCCLLVGGCVGGAAPAAPSNPVLDADFPDPDVLRVGGTYYAFATNADGANVQVARSTDLARWERLPNALPALPTWATAGRTWAPDVSAVDGGFALYFAARHGESGRQCIGVARSASPAGPFVAAGEAPLICQLDEGGSIDAATFLDDDGRRYLLWKSDGNCCGIDTWLYLQPVSTDGLTLIGTPRRLLTADQGWEGFLVEAPTLWKRNGRYYLFYSANRFGGDEYAVGYAVADAITGPYRKPERPVLTSRPGDPPIIGPGGQDIVADTAGQTWIAYHTWDPSLDYRRLYLAELAWEEGRPVVKDPGRSPK